MEFFDLVFPKKCVGCGRWGDYVCRDCEVGMWEEEQICPVCRRNSRYGLRHKYCNRPGTMEGLTCLWAYEGLAKKLIKQAKYKFYYDYLYKLTENSLNLIERPEHHYFFQFLGEKPTVVPVPLFPGRQRERGFNQAEIIARNLAKTYNLRLVNLLIRTRDTGRQVERSREERLKAMENAFRLNSKFKNQNSNQIQNSDFQIPKNVLLVDDVWTTGATLSEAARVLKQVGVKVVWGWVLAK